MKSRVLTMFLKSDFSGLTLLTLLDPAVKGFVLLAVATLLAFMLRGASAATRHLLWIISLTASLALPIAAAFLPRWQVLPAWMSMEKKPVAGVAQWQPVLIPRTQPAPAPGSLPAEDRPSAHLMSPAPAVVRESVSLEQRAKLVLLVWLGGAALLLAPLCYSVFSLWRIASRAQRIRHGPLLTSVHELQNVLGLTREIRLLVGEAEAMPMVWGILRPTLLLPAGAAQWAPALLRGVLLHELAHLRRRDPISMLLARFALAAHWFNPLAWFAVRELRSEQECACDDYVLRQGLRASDYAEGLLAVATGRRLFATAALAMANPTRLEGRIAGILDSARNRRALSRGLAACAVLIAFCIVLPLAMLRAEDRKTAPPTVSSTEVPPAVKPAEAVPAAIPTNERRRRGRLLDRGEFVLADFADDNRRAYPFQALAGHLLGFASAGPKGRTLEGRAGAEKIFDAQLTSGEDVHLTLDARLQSVVENTLRKAGVKRGAVVILDPATGDVLALASTPSFDPSPFTPAIALEQWQGLNNDPAVPLLNRALQATTPGSTFKLVVALAAERAKRADRVYTCSGTVQYGTKIMKCWKNGGHGTLGLHAALTHSCNCYFFQLANEVGIKAIDETAELLGLGQLSGIDLQDENPGFVPSPEALRTTHPEERWSAGYTANVGIGQGETRTTPLQMASVAATIANDGKVLTPRLRANGPPLLRRDLAESGFRPEHFAAVRAAMRDTVMGANGTGAKARSSSMAIAGKTGTAQSWRMEAGRKITEQHAWFVGYAPADSPRYAFAVLVEDGESGGSTSAVLARSIMEATAAGLPAPQRQSPGSPAPK